MGRRKTAYPDLPPKVTGRRCGNRLLYYYQSEGQKIALGSDREQAIAKAKRIRNAGMPAPEDAKLGDLAFLSASEIAARAVPMRRQSGIYFLVLNARIVYVGQSMDVWQRVQQHRITGRRFDSFAWVPCPLHDLDRLEAHCISKFVPEQNTRGIRTAQNVSLASP